MGIITSFDNVFQAGQPVPRQEVFELAQREIRSRVRLVVKKVIEDALEAEVTAKLGRGRYQRRRKSPKGFIDWRCSNCNCNKREDMSRDGHYKRDLGTNLAYVRDLMVPRVECQRCKDSKRRSSQSAEGKVRKGRGKVKTDFAVLRRAKRFWADVDKNSLFKAGFCQSLRQMAEELGAALESSVGLQTLNKRVNAAVEAAKQWKEQPIKDVPDVLQVDGLPFGVMEETGEIKLDRKKRRRGKKKGSKRMLLVALGIWSQTGQKQILDFEIVRQEGYEEWKAFLNRLYQRGLRREAGLEVIVHDGSKGLEAVIEEVYWQLKDQRCIFHKLMNVSDNIKNKEDGQRKKEVKADAKAIYEAETKEEARKRAEGFTRKWGTEEPKAVASLMSDFEKTLTYYDLPDKRRELVRTISIQAPIHYSDGDVSGQERMNRELRRKVRQVGVFWSEEGPEATFYLIAERLNRQWRKQTWIEATTPLAFGMVA